MRAFEKIEGNGNDFVVVDASVWSPDASEARRISDRHRGVGADGVLVVDRAARSMVVINADGTRPEMCGNGIRCVTLWLAARGELRVGETIHIATDAGPHACTLLAASEHEATVEVAMRPYAIAPDPKLVRADAPWLDRAIVVDGREIVGSFVSMGNPHFVIFDAERQRARDVAPAIEAHAAFPSHVNVGLAELRSGGAAVEITLSVFERGVGYTEACGTGACAAVAAAVETGRVRRGESVRVRLPGGPLDIVVGARGEPVRMTGPARRVFTGEI